LVEKKREYKLLLITLPDSNTSDSKPMLVAQFAFNTSGVEADIWTGQEVCSNTTAKMNCGLSRENCGECSEFS